MGIFFARCLNVTFYKKDFTQLSEHVFYLFLLFAHCNIIMRVLQTKYAFLLACHLYIIYCEIWWNFNDKLVLFDVSFMILTCVVVVLISMSMF